LTIKLKINYFKKKDRFLKGSISYKPIKRNIWIPRCI